jgi:hypothetical protein
LLERVSRDIFPPIGKPVMDDTLARVRYRLTESSEWTLGALSAHDHLHFMRSVSNELADNESGRSYAWSAYEKSWEKLSSRTLLTHTLINSQKRGQLRDHQDTEWFSTLDDERKFRTVQLREDLTLALAGSTVRWGAAATHERADINYFRDSSFPEGVASLLGRPIHEVFSVTTTTTLSEYEAYIAMNRPLSERVTVDGVCIGFMQPIRQARAVPYGDRGSGCCSISLRRRY